MPKLHYIDYTKGTMARGLIGEASIIVSTGGGGGGRGMIIAAIMSTMCPSWLSWESYADYTRRNNGKGSNRRGIKGFMSSEGDDYSCSDVDNVSLLAIMGVCNLDDDDMRFEDNSDIGLGDGWLDIQLHQSQCA